MPSMETLMSGVGLVLTCLAVGGIAWVGFGELRLRAARRSRLATAGSANAAVGPAGRPIAEGVMATVRRLGQQSAVRDPAKLSLLRSRLMQAGFYNKEAPVIFLGVKAAAVVAATVAVLMTVPVML